MGQATQWYQTNKVLRADDGEAGIPYGDGRLQSGAYVNFLPEIACWGTQRLVYGVGSITFSCSHRLVEISIDHQAIVALHQGVSGITGTRSSVIVLGT